MNRIHEFVLKIPCLFGWHSWLARGEYRRICHFCPASQIWTPEEGWES